MFATLGFTCHAAGIEAPHTPEESDQRKELERLKARSAELISRSHAVIQNGRGSDQVNADLRAAAAELRFLTKDLKGPEGEPRIKPTHERALLW